MKRKNQEEILGRHNYLWSVPILCRESNRLTHHMNEFIILMENYGTASEYTEKSLNSTGEAMQKFADYQKSVTAHTELFTKAVQDLANTAVNSGLVNFFIDLGTFGVNAIDGLVGSLSPLGTILTTLGGYLGAKNLG